MSVIRVLPESIVNRIAAGEVVERPASIVKELVENALDAGALKIKINIEKAGSSLISVTDDGCGMDMEDLLLCLQQHATSKIGSAEDIQRIYTLGFRGEALPSIASISRVRLRSRRKDSGEGHEVRVEGGRIVNSEPVGCAPGTEVSVREIFFNVPARKKFLKTSGTEEKHIIETVNLLALANPETAFELDVDDRQVLSSPANKEILPRLKSLFGKSFAEAMLPVSFKEHGVFVAGYIAKHGYTRPARREQRFFVNRRPVQSPVLYGAVKEGYGSLVAGGRYPPALLFIELDPGSVDVNVHPAKREIRFKKDRLVAGVLSRALREALRLSHAPTVSVDKNLSLRNMLAGASVDYRPREGQDHDSFVDADRQAPARTPAPPVESVTPPAHEEPKHVPGREISDGASVPGAGRMQIIGMLAETYIIASSEKGLVLIDQHAAHERVLFEKMLRAMENPETMSQKLLIPVNLELSAGELSFVRGNRRQFMEAGFHVEDFGRDSIAITAIPSVLAGNDITGLFMDMLDEIQSVIGRRGQTDNTSIARAACRQAIKASDRISTREAEELVRRMAECEMPFSCPHGRPTIINISFGELEKRFGRA